MLNLFLVTFFYRFKCRLPFHDIPYLQLFRSFRIKLDHFLLWIFKFCFGTVWQKQNISYTLHHVYMVRITNNKIIQLFKPLIQNENVVFLPVSFFTDYIFALYHMFHLDKIFFTSCTRNCTYTYTHMHASANTRYNYI